MKWSRAIIPAAIVMPLLIVLFLAFGTNPSEIPFVLRGKPAPDFTLQTFDGQTVTFASLKGKPVILNFWSTWCQPCKVEHDFLQDGSRAYGDQVTFVGIIYQDSAEAAKSYLSHRKNFYTQLADDDSTLAIEYGVSGVPETYFIDAAGIIRYKQAGPITSPGELAMLMQHAFSKGAN